MKRRFKILDVGKLIKHSGMQSVFYNKLISEGTRWALIEIVPGDLDVIGFLKSYDICKTVGETLGEVIEDGSNQM